VREHPREIINRAHANVAIDIHADGGPARRPRLRDPRAGRRRPNDQVIGASSGSAADAALPATDHRDAGEHLRRRRRHRLPRDNLAGLNLTTVPKVLIECGNMRNATDAALLVPPSFQRSRRGDGAGDHDLTAGR
jgi:N-acetylmuramoyl-L-alanine amidase